MPDQRPAQLRGLAPEGPVPRATRGPKAAAQGAVPFGDRPSRRARDVVTHVLESSPFPILLVSLVGIVLLTVFGPSLIVGDTWLTLMAGREVVENGLPRTEEITILGQGATWTDQQWLAQVVFYGAHELAGMRAVVVLDVLLVVLALGLTAAGARSGGASSRSTFLVGLLAVLAGPWGWTIRAQTAALPLFAGVLWLLLDAARRGVRHRTLLVLPALVLWANLHGSVVLGAILTMLLAGYALVRARRLEWLSIALLVLAPLCVLATPYGWDIVAYYELMLVDAPFAEILREWQWSSPSGTTLLFYVLAVVAVALVALRRCRRRLNVFELLVLGVTLVGAVQAVRGVIWFALAAAAILPIALDGLITRADVGAPKVNRIISLAALTGLSIAFVVTIARPSSWFVSEWPERHVEAVRQATRDPETRLWATDGTADWLLWRIPDLRGRVAYDVRFELYDERALAKIIRYGRRDNNWVAVLDGYDRVVVEGPRESQTVTMLLEGSGAKLEFSERDFAIVSRP